MNTKTSSSTTSSIPQQRRKQQQRRATTTNKNNKTLKDLNHNNKASSSSSVPSETPKGCLRFFVSHHSSTTTAKKSNNLANKCVYEKPILPKKKKNTTLRSCKSSYNVKTPSFVLNSKFRSSEIDKENDASLTTPLCKDDNNVVRKDGDLSCGSSKAVTPPIVATVSPEIQCGSDAVSKMTTVTPVCYGTGHVMSGIVDKRKCRPRGVLVVGENCLEFGKGEDEAEGAGGDREDVGRGSVAPLPIEASMRWLLSPCEDDGENWNEGNLDTGNVQLSVMKYSDSLGSSLPSFSGGISSSLYGNSNGTSTTSTYVKSRKRSNGFSSPFEVREFHGFFRSRKDGIDHFSLTQADTVCKDNSLVETERYRNDCADEKFVLSNDSPGSGNVMRTPELDSSPENHVRYPWFMPGNRKNSQFVSELDSPTELVETMRLSPKAHASLLDSVKSEPQSDDHTMPSTSLNSLLFHNVLGNQVSWESSFASENMSLSQMRISWRDGQVSLDELDCCRYLSDEEEDPSEYNKEISRSHQDQEFNAGIKDGESEGKGKYCPPLPCPCTESISSDGRELFASGDSDWNLWYKNSLYEV